MHVVIALVWNKPCFKSAKPFVSLDSPAHKMYKHLCFLSVEYIWYRIQKHLCIGTKSYDALNASTTAQISSLATQNLSKSYTDHIFVRDM